MKITEKVSFKIASEASYIFILSGQKLIKNAKNGHFWRVFENAIFWVIFKHCADRLCLTTSLFPLLSSKKIILVTSACFRSMATTAGDQKWLWKMVVLRTTLVHNVRGWWQGRNIVLQLIWDTDKKDSYVINIFMIEYLIFVHCSTKIKKPICTVLKITEKVTVNMASEGSHIYILGGQKFIKTSKWSNLASFWKPEETGQTVLPDRSTLFGGNFWHF